MILVCYYYLHYYVLLLGSSLARLARGGLEDASGKLSQKESPFLRTHMRVLHLVRGEKQGAGVRLIFFFTRCLLEMIVGPLILQILNNPCTRET